MFLPFHPLPLLSLALSALRLVNMAYFNSLLDGNLFIVTFKRLYKETGGGVGEKGTFLL
jgi:hypothetical protein